MFGVSPNTIRWANDLSPNSKLKAGQTLTILPVTGVKYKIKSGDTIASLAKKFDANADDILNFNGIDGDLAIGTEIIIPDGEIAAEPTPAPKAPGSKPKGVVKQIIVEATSAIGNYAAPLARYVKTQGVHGYNAVDLAAPIGTPIMASADGDVIIAKPSGWNGGYGSYVVLHHDDGSQTLYGHASRVIVSEGQHVVQGQVIAYVGSTGKSTGSHLHFEIRNGVRNPF
jgi:murein DD-endopeptidase MepM/ murein hydrolase activator NlpD